MLALASVAQKLNIITTVGVRLIVEIHEIQFSEVTNYRNPRNPPPISRNPHAKKRNPTPATKSTATPPKANYRNPPALDREPRFLNVVAKCMAVEMRFCTHRCGYGIFILIFSPLCNVRGRPSI